MYLKCWEEYRLDFISKKMKTTSFIVIIVLSATTSLLSQVGVNTVTPSSNSVLDLTSTGKGFLLPKMPTVQRTAIFPAPIADKGMQVFDTDTNTAWFWNGSTWIEILNNSTYDINGNLTSNRTVNQENNTLSFLSSSLAPNAFSVDGSTFSVDTFNNRVGIRTVSPEAVLDTEGTMRLSPVPASNVPRISNSLYPLLADRLSGKLTYAPTGFTRCSGGFRPVGSNTAYIIANLPTTNTIVKVRFVCHVDQSNEQNNSDDAAYAYGDFTILGTGIGNPIKIIEKTVKGFDGLPKTLLTDSPTSFSWSNYSQLTTTISVNQTTGALTINNQTFTFSYIFEIMGGM